jgi:hypothetical protein
MATIYASHRANTSLQCRTCCWYSSFPAIIICGAVNHYNCNCLTRLQVSKLTTLLLRACRTAAGSSSWDPLVAGTAVGKLVELQELDPSALEAYDEPVVVLLRSANGDEEVSAAGHQLQGVVLTQDLPHLSHLGELKKLLYV